MKVKCICGDYLLTYRDILELSPSRARPPTSIECPSCHTRVRATKKSRLKFAGVLAAMFVALGFGSAYWFSIEAGPWAVVIVVAGLLIHYVAIWPNLLELESEPV